jgi:hypothetical protein
LNAIDIQITDRQNVDKMTENIIDIQITDRQNVDKMTENGCFI